MQILKKATSFIFLLENELHNAKFTARRSQMGTGTIWKSNTWYKFLLFVRMAFVFLTCKFHFNRFVILVTELSMNCLNNWSRLLCSFKIPRCFCSIMRASIFSEFRIICTNRDAYRWLFQTIFYGICCYVCALYILPWHANTYRLG